ncbi:MAG: flagellar motor protein MotB [Verrucomicrobiae bacterium]
MSKKHDAHHGGAWKVAYADFVTAMMALFMVLWICSQKPEIVEATARYFQDPYIASQPASSGTMEEHVAGSRKEANKPSKKITANEGWLRAVARDFSQLLNIKTAEDSPIDIELTAEGLKISIYNKDEKPLFKQGTAELTEWGTFVLQNLSWLIERYNFHVFIDGHTGRMEDKKKRTYGPWELSADRANSARRALEHFAVDPKKIERVTGYGDTAPIPGIDPNLARNERITISLSATQNVTQAPPASNPISQEAAQSPPADTPAAQGAAQAPPAGNPAP